MKTITILFDSQYNICGKVIMQNINDIDSNERVLIHIYAKNLKPGLHGFHIHKSGDLTKHCDSLCSHYNPTNDLHGGRNTKVRHLGDLGNIKANSKGIVRETFTIGKLDLKDVLGRSLIIHEDEDDLGIHIDNEDSIKTGNSGKRVLCGIIGLAIENC